MNKNEFSRLANYLDFVRSNQIIEDVDVVIHEPRFAWEIFLEAGYELPITLEELPSDPLILETAKYAISTMHRPNPRVAINYALTFYNVISPKSIRTNRGSSSCLLYTSPSPRDRTRSRMPSSA